VKIPLLIFCLTFLCAFQKVSSSKKNEQADEISKIKAYIIHGSLQGMKIATPIDIKCSIFLQMEDLDSFDLTKYKDEVTKIISFPNKKVNWTDIDTRAKLLIWHKSGRVDSVCMSYLPEIMTNSSVYISDSTKYGFYHPYDNFMYFLRGHFPKQ